MGKRINVEADCQRYREIFEVTEKQRNKVILVKASKCQMLHEVQTAVAVANAEVEAAKDSEERALRDIVILEVVHENYEAHYESEY